MFFQFFDRTPVSRDRDGYGLTEISSISGRRQRFGMRQRFDHFEHGGPVQTSRYSTGESPLIKAGHWRAIFHLESTCTRFNTSARKRTRPSARPERSQQLEIPPSLNSFDSLFIPQSWPTRNKGCVRPHLFRFIPAFAYGERRRRVRLLALEGERMLFCWGFSK